eukprot:TRINITY_DN56204_c0_g1_i1.p1 TRINITY_DN56204_c0_g1~~TRINITY_DN56204_c0_g1_i1.p1  ORF type:complete len:360 (+),score=98.72 TRINITY_DN56204_c0_g1_i1:87-1166(+)
MGACCSGTVPGDYSPPQPDEGTQALNAGSPSSFAYDNADEGEDAKKLEMMKNRGKRQGIAAESVNVQDVKDYVKPVYAKSPEGEEEIKAVIKSNEKMQVLFGHLSAAVLQDVINAFQEASFKEGEVLIRQGEEGDRLFIISSGEVDVYVRRPSPDGSKPAPDDLGPKVVSLGSKALFGELALMYSAPRAATVKVTSPTLKCWQLDREPFKMLLAQTSSQQLQMYEGWLSEVDILKSLNKYELSNLSEIMSSDLFDDNEDIIKQGDPGDKFFILEDGECAAYIKGPDGEKKVKDYTRQGDYFGEIALLTDEPRKATVRAGPNGASVLSCSKEDFTNVLGPIQDILRKDVDKYPQYAQFIS